MLHRVAILSHVVPDWYDCCVDSCAAFTGTFSEYTHCPNSDCKKPRFTASGKPRRMFAYLPIIPRLQGFFQNPKSAERLLYRHNYQHVPGEISTALNSTATNLVQALSPMSLTANITALYAPRMLLLMTRLCLINTLKAGTTYVWVYAWIPIFYLNVTAAALRRHQSCSKTIASNPRYEPILTR